MVDLIGRFQRVRSRLICKFLLVAFVVAKEVELLANKSQVGVYGN